MKEVGIFLFLAGLVAIVAPLLLPANFRFPLLDWINNWGPTTAWLIKGSAVLVGLLLWLRFRNQD